MINTYILLISHLVCESLKFLLGELLDTPGHNKPVLVGGGDQLDVFEVGWLRNSLLVNQAESISNLELW